MTQSSVQVGVIGDFDSASASHAATNEGLQHAAELLDVELVITWLPTPSLEGDLPELLADFDALWCAPGSPYQSLEGALAAIRFARIEGRPFIGTCGGFQHVVIEYARNVLGVTGAQHAEYDPTSSDLFISELTCALVGERMSVGIDPASRVRTFYGQSEVEEEYHCTFGLNPKHQSRLHDGGLRVVGVDQDGEARILELPRHPFFVATLFVPPLTSTPESPHPLIVGLVQTALRVRPKGAAVFRQ